MVTIALIISALVSFVLGVLVFVEQKRIPSSISFFLTMIGTALWAAGIAVFLSTQSEEILLTSATVYYIAAALIALSTFLFSYFFTMTNKVTSFSLLATAPFLLMTVVLLIDPHVLIEQVTVGLSNTAQLNMSFYIIYIIYFVIYYGGALALVLRRLLKERSSIPRKHFLYVFIAYSSAGIIGTLFNLFLPAFGNYDLIWAGPLGLLVFVPIVYLAIAKFGLFDIRQTVVRTVAYIFSLIVLAVIYYAVAYVVSLVLFGGQASQGISISPVNILLALMLSFIFQPIKNFFDRVTDNFFFRDRYKSEDFYARLSEVLTTTTDLRNLLQRAAMEIGDTLKSEQAFFFLQYDEGKRHITAGTKDHKDLPLDDIKSLNSYVRTNGDNILVTQLLENNNKLKRILISHKVALLMPLMHHDRAVGYLALGEQKSTGYTNRDIKVLKTISDELIIAIQNALSVQEVRAINASLEQRIEMATAELRTSNARLKRLDASKDEFLSMASHQLRTPLTSVKGYLSMMIDGDVGKISAMQKQVLEEAFSSSERMVHLIHDFLNVSRLQTGKFMLELSDVKLADLIQQEVNSLEKVASSHNMKLEFQNTAGDIQLRIDDTKIRQVVMNYIDNAIYYSHPDSTIFVELSNTDKEVILEIKDTGIGVPKNEQEQLFSKFYRASNARKQRPDGTGVGIFLAKKVITALGGDIVFRSKEGKGSVFGFRLPLDQDQELLENNSKQLT